MCFKKARVNRISCIKRYIFINIKIHAKIQCLKYLRKKTQDLYFSDVIATTIYVIVFPMFSPIMVLQSNKYADVILWQICCTSEKKGRIYSSNLLLISNGIDDCFETIL